MKTTTTVISDDLGSAGPATTTTYTHNGHTYEIDLNKRNTETLHRRIAALYDPLIAVSRDVTPTTANRVHTTEHLTAVREWARGNGYEVADRGRVPARLLSEYESENAS